MELECAQLKAQLKDIEKQESKLLPHKICLCQQLGLLSKKNSDTIRCELTVIKDQETLKQEISHVVSLLSLDDLFSSEVLASIKSLSPSVLASASFLGGNSAASHLSQS